MTLRKMILDEIKISKAFIDCNGNVNDERFTQIYEELRSQPASERASDFFYDQRLRCLKSMQIPAVEMQLESSLKQLHEIDHPDEATDAETLEALLDAIDDTPAYDAEEEKQSEKLQQKEEKQSEKPQLEEKKQPEKRRPGRPKKQPEPQITFDDFAPTFEDIGWD